MNLFIENSKVYGFVCIFENQQDTEKCRRLYEDQFLLFDNKEYRDKRYHDFMLEATSKFNGRFDIVRFTSSNKTYQELVEWIDQTFLENPIFL